LPFASTNEENIFLKKMIKKSNLEDLLDVIYRQLKKDYSFDGCIFNIWDPDQESFIIEKIFLPDNIKQLEKVLWKAKNPYQNELLAKINVHPVVINKSEIKNWDEQIQIIFEYWKLESGIWIPLLFEKDLLGFITLISQTENLSADWFPGLNQVLEIAMPHLANCIHFWHLQTKELEIHNNYFKQKKLLEIIEHMSHLNTVDKIYRIILTELLKIFHFDIGFAFMASGDKLELVSSLAEKETHLTLIQDFENYYRSHLYSIKNQDGVIANTFSKGNTYLFRDIEKIKKLPMTEKDMQFTLLLKNPRTFIHVPIKKNKQPVGVLTLGSIEETLKLYPQDIKTIESICSLLGTALENASLYSLVEQQKMELEEANVQLYDLARTKEELLDILAHDLKGPIGTISNFTQILEEVNIKERRECVQYIQDASGRMLDLIQDVLKISSLESHQNDLEKERINLRDFVIHIQKSFELNASLKEIQLNAILPDEPLFISAHDGNLWQIFNNLINNALKFTPEGKSITIECKKLDNQAQILIKDTGIGIPADKLPVLFQKFTPARRKGLKGEKSTGLGLFIVKKLVELHQGQITVSSTLGKGTQFEIVLPLID
jgi:signal transduction histidine kinase